MGRIECGRPPCSGSRLRTRSFSPTGMPVTRSFRYRLSRRQALAGIAASMVWRPGFSDTVPVRAPAESDGSPVFYSGGPDAELYGAAEGFPILDRSLSFHLLNHTKPKYRVGAFSHLDAIFKTREIARAAAPWHFKRSPLDIQYSYGGTSSSLADYLARNPVTGLLLRITQIGDMYPSPALSRTPLPAGERLGVRASASKHNSCHAFTQSSIDKTPPTGPLTNRLTKRRQLLRYAHVIRGVVLRPWPDIFRPGRIHAHRACATPIAAIAVHADRIRRGCDAIFYPVVENLEVVPIDQILPVAVRESRHEVEPHEAVGRCLAHGGDDRQVQALIGVRADAGVVESLHQQYLPAFRPER